MVGEISETTPAIKLMTPKAAATPDPELYFGISFCLLTLSNPKVNPQQKRMNPVNIGFPVKVKRIMAGEVAKMWKANEISPPYLSTVLPPGR